MIRQDITPDNSNAVLLSQRLNELSVQIIKKKKKNKKKRKEKKGKEKKVKNKKETTNVHATSPDKNRYRPPPNSS